MDTGVQDIELAPRSLVNIFLQDTTGLFLYLAI